MMTDIICDIDFCTTAYSPLWEGGEAEIKKPFASAILSHRTRGKTHYKQHLTPVQMWLE